MIVNLETFSDSDFQRKFLYATSTGLPISLIDSTLRMMVRAHAVDATTYIECSMENGRIVLDYGGAVGAFLLWIPLAELSVLAPGNYVHSLIRTRVLNTVPIRSPIWRGTLVHSAGPTR